MRTDAVSRKGNDRVANMRLEVELRTPRHRWGGGGWLASRGRGGRRRQRQLKHEVPIGSCNLSESDELGLLSWLGWQVGRVHRLLDSELSCLKAGCSSTTQLLTGQLAEL